MGKDLGEVLFACIVPGLKLACACLRLPAASRAGRPRPPKERRSAGAWPRAEKAILVKMCLGVVAARPFDDGESAGQNDSA